MAGEAAFFSVWLNPLEYPLALDLISGKIVDIKGLITHRFPLAEFENAIETTDDPSKRPVKVILQ